MKSEDLPLLNSVSAPALHPDGTRAVVSVLRPDFDADAYVGQLWTVPLDPDQRPRRLTRGFRDVAPYFSPDGQVLAFLRAAPGGKPQLHIVEAGGGEPQPVTDALLGVSAFAWSPDSRHIVFSARTPEDGRYGSTDGVSAGSEDARLITDYQYRMNGVGYTADKPVQLFLVEVPDPGAEPGVAPQGRALKARAAAAAGQAATDAASTTPAGLLPAARQLTTAATDHTGASFSTDGRTIYFTAALHEGSDNDLASGIYRITVEEGSAGAETGAEPEPVTPANTGRQSVHAVRESRDGLWLFFLAQDLGPTGQDFVARNTALYVAPAGGGDATRLSDIETMDLGCNGRLELGGPDSELPLNNARGTVELLEFQAAGTHRTLVRGERVVTGAAAHGESLVLSFTDASTAGDVAVLDAGQLRVATDFSAPLRSGTDIIEPVELTVPSGDGYPVHGWLVKPQGQGPHPVLLTIHGGPFAQFTGALFDEAQVYAAAGYAILMCNPRGSAGYGQEHGRAIKEKMGSLDMQDVLAFLDGALGKFEALDAGALGIMGGSYGGYLTAWTISHDHRFKAAIVERGFLDPVSFTGSSDIGWFFGGEYTGRSAGQMAAQSPMARVEQVRTPSLVIHSEEDLRCPVEQGQRYFTALKQLGVDAAFLVFPGENHELSRAGTPHHRKQRFDRILQWWSRYLPTAANPAPADRN